jgi:acetyl esterase/lipase
MSLDPGVADYLARVAAAVPPLTEPTPVARRNRMELIARRFPAPEDTVARGDAWIALPGREVAVRIYRPRPGTLPAIVYLHGGGWVAGSLATHDGACAALAQDADAVVASVHYRRAPESPYPAPNDDAYAALAWVAEHADALAVDRARIAVAGDSAGAHLAIGCAIEARDARRRRVRNCSSIRSWSRRSTPRAISRARLSPTLTRDGMIWYWRCSTCRSGRRRRARRADARFARGIAPRPRRRRDSRPAARRGRGARGAFRTGGRRGDARRGSVASARLPARRSVRGGGALRTVRTGSSGTRRIARVTFVTDHGPSPRKPPTPPREPASAYDPTGIDDGKGGIALGTRRPALRATAWIVSS